MCEFAPYGLPVSTTHLPCESEARLRDSQFAFSFGWRGILEKGQEAVESEADRRFRESLAMFSDEISAHRYLERVLWPDGVCCPRCGDGEKVGELNGVSTRIGTYKCYKCRKIFSVLHGTLMSASHVPAHKWLQAMWLTEGGAKPMRAYHLARILNVSFKTASSMMRRIVEATRPASSYIESPGATRSQSTLRSADRMAARLTT